MGGEQGRAYSAAAMSPFGISLLMLLAFAGFAALAWRKLQVVLALQPEVRWDQPWQRARSVLVNGLLQQRMLQREWRAGLMHAVIFLGFMSLLLRKLQLIAIGYDEHFVFPAAFGGPFAAFKDVDRAGCHAGGAVCLLAALRAAAGAAGAEPRGAAGAVADPGDHAHRLRLRRLSFRAAAPTRCQASRTSATSPSSAARWPRPSPGLSPALLSAGYTLSYWTQMVVVFCFLVLLPAGEHFHIVTALPALFFRRGRPAQPRAAAWTSTS